MRRQGFLLGLFSVGGQVLLLRELVSSLNGDELFIGTALFGWLIAVAFGAYTGGKAMRPKNSNIIFIPGVILLPLMIICLRWSPLLVTSVTGEMVPFVKAALISIIAMVPIGFLSGWLFPLITRKVVFPATSPVIMVYLFEGIGAFVGGLVTSLLVVWGRSDLVIAATICIIVLSGLLISRNRWINLAIFILIGLFIAIGMNLVRDADRYAEQLRNREYRITASLYSPYGKHLILKRGGGLTLVTDNNIEAAFPDPETAENHFLVPRIYYPEADKLLYVGRADFVLPSIDDKQVQGRVTAVDPREKLSESIRIGLNTDSETRNDWYYTDPVDYFVSRKDFNFYDIIVINSGRPDKYVNSRYFTPQFLQAVKSRMADSCILSIPLTYDTDRYLTPEVQDVLSIIYATLSSQFANVIVWPGTTTIFLASEHIPLELTYDEIIGRLNKYNLNGDFISDVYLFDRLGEMKVERLRSAVTSSSPVNTLKRPILVHYQALYRSTAYPIDRSIISAILGSTWWLIILPIGVLLFFIIVYRRRNGDGSDGLFLYFTAGAVSLSLELISFYLYQTTAGSLYGELSLLIGIFMVGLALGTWYSHRIGDRPLEFPALIILLTSIIIFLSMYNRIDIDALLPFYMLFLFVVAVATGTLFVAATNRYYAGEKRTNRGAGYAWEIIGSSLGALFTLTVLLPAIGLTWLMLSLAGVVVLALVGSVLLNKPLRAY